MSNKLTTHLMAAGLLFLGTVISGQEPEESEPPPAEESAEEPEPPVSDDIFIPSEEVQADEELAFPVNI